MSRSPSVRAAACLLACVGVAGCEKPQVKLAAPRPPVVVVAQPVSDYVADYEDFTGRTDAVFSVEIRARVSGFLDKVLFRDGDEVKEGDVLFEIDNRPYKANLNRTEATLAQAEAHFKRLDADYRRVANLYSRGNASREEFDKSTGDRSEGEAAVGVARSDYDLAKLNMTFTRITAPISGLLSRRLVDPGNLVQADTTPMTTIVSLDPMFVYFDVDERTLLRIRRLIRDKKIPSRQEEAVPVHVALSDESSFPHEGVINFSDNRVDPGTGTLRVRASIPNPKPRVLSPGMFVRVRVPIGSPRKSIMIAEKAIGTDQGQKYLFIVDDKNTAWRKKVTVGKLDSGLREIADGLAQGDRVVVEGLQRIRNGQEVDPKTEEEIKAPPKAGAGAKKVASREGGHG